MSMYDHSPISIKDMKTSNQRIIDKYTATYESKRERVDGFAQSVEYKS